ncbi:MAG: DNA repair protein RecO [Chitinivibrionales bacterium]|nr:DNA repair protein RecO [Chitinivibrionales bacterium]
MAIEKISGIIIKSMPYRESSYIFHLFTNSHGMLHCIAKGVRKKKEGASFLERGFLVEAVVYLHANRELHTLTQIAIIDFFQTIRTDIVKTALRDSALELIAAAVTAADSHLELFDFFRKYLTYLDNSEISVCHPSALWLFYYRFCQYMGVGMNLATCIGCKESLSDRAFLMISRGGLLCSTCMASMGQNEFDSGGQETQSLTDCIDTSREIPLSLRTYLLTANPKPQLLHQSIASGEKKRITYLLSDYCRHHFDIPQKPLALACIDEIHGW